MIIFDEDAGLVGYCLGGELIATHPVTPEEARYWSDRVRWSKLDREVRHEMISAMAVALDEQIMGTYWEHQMAVAEFQTRIGLYR